MFSDLKKSVSSIFYDRVSSPFWGTLATSWLVWNWKILVLLFIVSEDKLPVNKLTTIQYTKIEYIVANYSNGNNLFIGPFLSTIVIITLVPFLVNGAYWLSLRFKKWRLDKKNEVEMRQLLTIEQSLQLRTEIKNQEKKFQDILEDKNVLIDTQGKTISNLQNDFSEKSTLLEQFKNQVEQQKNVLRQKETENRGFFEQVANMNDEIARKESVINEQISYKKDFQNKLIEKDNEIARLKGDYNLANSNLKDLTVEVSRLSEYRTKYEIENNLVNLLSTVISNEELEKSFNSIMILIQRFKGDFGHASISINTKGLAFFEGNSLIEQQNGKYTFTSRGKEFLRLYSSRKGD